jgi:Ca-activated chloride channel family protein
VLGVVAAVGCRASSSHSPSAPSFEGPRTVAFAPPASDELRADGMFAYTDPGELPRLLIAGEKGGELPLRHTHVDAEVRGHVAEVLVTQSFTNDRAEAVEVTYTFPLPENAAVDDMHMVIGERVIQSEVQTRAQARDTYEQARSAGYTAALLEQERPNIFTQSVANIPPGETIEVELAYLQTLTRDGGRYEFVFPMVVGPRFIPGAPTRGKKSGTGRVADTDAVPDASRITPPVLGEGQRSGHDVSLNLVVAAGTSISSWEAPTHTVTGEATSEGFALRLADAETIPNRDFVLRWNVAAATPRASLFLGPADASGRGHFSLVVEPPQLDLDAVVGRREMIFVVDRSGSMSGLPLALAKQTLREALRRLRPVDTFDVVGFESGTERLFGTPRAANEHNLVLAERFIDAMVAGGGTMMAGAVEAALAPRLSEGRHRYVFFLTDGYIGNEDEIFRGAAALVARAEKSGARARVFGLGIGAEPNRHLIAGLSRAGDGAALYLSNREHPREAVESYYRYVDHPVLEDLEIDWAGLEVEELYPGELPGLFASHAVVLLGRYRGGFGGDPKLVARSAGGGEVVDLPITVANSGEGDRVLATLWAREKIAELEAATWDGALRPDEAAAAITTLGLDYHQVTAYTSFVAVDDSRVVGDGRPDHLVMPVEVPEDVDPVMSGAYGSSTSRDFTAVVDIAPTVSYDSAGISLAGTTGAETKYAVDGANVDMSMQESTIIRESIERGDIDGPVGGSWAPRAKLSIGDIRLDEGGSARDLKRALRGRSRMFEACYEQRVGNPGKATLRVRLRFGAGGELTDVELLDGGLGSEEADGCIEYVLGHVEWRGLPSGETSVELQLSLRMR